VDPEAYWRRRFFILGGGLGAAMILAWVFGSGGPSPSASGTAAERAAAAARDSRTELPAAAYGTAWTTAPATPSPSAQPSATTSPTARPSASPSALPSATQTLGAKDGTRGKPAATATATARAAAGQSSGAQCAPGNMVLSLFTSQPGYSPAQKPVFDVYAVSTQTRACTLAFGPSSVRVVVTRHGRVAWDSAACTAHGASARPVSFAQGVPQEVALTWNRKAANAGCSGSLVPGEWGTFQAVATADGHSTPARSFTLKP
jgi:hypothetical protein